MNKGIDIVIDKENDVLMVDGYNPDYSFCGRLSRFCDWVDKNIDCVVVCDDVINGIVDQVEQKKTAIEMLEENYLRRDEIEQYIFRHHGK